MFKNLTKKNIIRQLRNKDHLRRESKLKIDVLYLFFFIPVVLYILNSFLIIPLFRGEFGIADSWITMIFFIAGTINLYRFTWTYQNSFRCFFTFLSSILVFIIMVANFFSSPLSTTPANAIIYHLQNSPPLGILWADRWTEIIINDYALQQYIVDVFRSNLSIIYSHLILIFIIHYQIRRTQTMLYLHECKLEPEEIAEYIVDPENNSFLLEEAFHRSNFKNRNSFKDRFNNNYQYSDNDEYEKLLEEYDQNSSSSTKAEDFMKPIVPKKNEIKDE